MQIAGEVNPTNTLKTMTALIIKEIQKFLQHPRITRIVQRFQLNLEVEIGNEVRLYLTGCATEAIRGLKLVLLLVHL